MKKLGLMLIATMVLVLGCDNNKQQDPRIKAQEGVASDTLASNIVTRPIAHVYSAITGERITFTNTSMRRNNGGFLEVQVKGYNNSYNTERFQYKIKWLDAEGFEIDSKTNVWQNKSASAKSEFTITVAATNPDAADFRMDTRDQE